MIQKESKILSSYIKHVIDRPLAQNLRVAKFKGYTFSTLHCE